MGGGGILSYLQDILGGDFVLVNKKEWGGLCPGGILSGYLDVTMRALSREHGELLSDWLSVA